MAVTKHLLKSSDKSASDYLTRYTLLLLRALIGIILLAFLIGILKTAIDLLLLFGNLENALRQILVDALTLLAVVEVLKTINGYLSNGRVRVTFIVDTVLIVMLNEVISLWFKGTTIQNTLPLILILFSLIAIRTIAIRYSPDTEDK